MRFLQSLAAAMLAACIIAPAPAQAQAGDPAPAARSTMDPGSTGSVGALDRNITGVGQTKPPGAALGSGDGTTPELQRKSRELNRKIDTGICNGCD